MGAIATDLVAVHFQACLKVKQRADGNLIPDVAKGDCTILLMLIRMKLDDFEAQINSSNPGRFRGTAVLRSDMERVVGLGSRLHYTKWGASHTRGVFRDDDKRGNKRHLIRFAGLLNEYADTPARLQDVYDYCILLHHRFWEGFSLKVLVQEKDPFQKRLLSMLSLQSYGRVQQGLVYSALRRKYGDSKKITTKRTFAGDEQSSQTGTLQRGDVQVWSDEAVAISLEIKDAIIDATVWSRVEATHGGHDYALFVLGTGYRPSSLQWEIGSQSATYALHLADFLLTLVFTVAVDENQLPSEVLSEILSIYNQEFCEEIEDDSSIRIDVEVDPGDG